MPGGSYGLRSPRVRSSRRSRVSVCDFVRKALGASAPPVGAHFRRGDGDTSAGVRAGKMR
jgi:hypothetical protein